ncbi:nucleoid-associated protein [Methylobacterium sp. 391_Methyba4]|uniref:nucleoid-associated protein n=1 Tax=Methylobacterium sp. 391_Methyba4 TaxID=3038924 RepID=UPI00241C378C|nr:nucleoid-associated protein [Methylobacterium sp. 391_Methyba4]WFS06483.1 nucleoid-associated protein [Methylobacterium sp. 391_Methyba4]
MGFLQDEEKDALTIRRMIFHVVGKDLAEPVLLPEITPLQEPGFFLARVKLALRGNLFAFRDGAAVEATLRGLTTGGNFAEGTQALAREFHRLHRTGTSNGVFLVFELATGQDTVFALIKYDHDEVVHYSLGNPGEEGMPHLERLQKTFVKKTEAMQKIALVRLDPVAGGRIMVRDRSKPTHISEYFETFLDARRVNAPDELSGKLVDALRETFRKHKDTLPENVREGGVNRIYETLRQGGHRYDPEDPEPLFTAVFGRLAEDAPIRRTLDRMLREHGVSEETFEINPERVRKPSRRVMETAEGTVVLYDEGHRPTTERMEDGRERIEIVTAGITRDDVDIDKRTLGR